MLFLSRHEGERILIDNIEITIVRISKGNVRIGIDAPLDVKILRAELIEEDHEVGAD